MKSIKQTLYNLMAGTETGKFLIRKIINKSFKGSATYWEERYRKNGNSGKGSYGENAAYKADFINKFVAENNIQNVIEFGCGDGNQLKQFQFRSYIGLDVSPSVVKHCKEIFKDDTTKTFYVYNEKTSTGHIAELALSLDVIYHLVEDEVFEKYMKRLFSSSSKYVILYAWDIEEERKYHVRHRHFSKWIENNIRDFKLIEIKKNTGGLFCDFFIYQCSN